MGLIEKLEIRVNSISFQQNETVHVHFRGIDEQGRVNLNGHVVASEEEYFENAGRPEIFELVRNKLVERLETVVDAGGEGAE